MAIGTYKSIAINVTDLEQGYAFWSEVLGWEPVYDAEWHGWLGYLIDPDSDNYLILIDSSSAPVETSEPSHDRANRVHIDIYPNEGMDKAIEDVVALGGRLKKSPSLYPRPASRGRDAPVIDWAVMQDPFGNEFCLVEILSREQRSAAMAAETGDDESIRAAAGATGPREHPPIRARPSGRFGGPEEETSRPAD